MRRLPLLTPIFTIAIALTSTDAPARGHVTAGANPRLFHAHVPDPVAPAAPPPAFVGKDAKGNPIPYVPPPNVGPVVPVKMPLVILLHGLAVDATMQDMFFQMRTIADQRRFAFAYLDGTRNAAGLQFWNATDACCQFPNNANLLEAAAHGAHGVLGAITATVGGPPVDDVAYINATIDVMTRTYPIDEKRIFIVAHSNGGFMAHRFACENNRVAAIATLSGAQWFDAAKCPGTHKVSVLHIHGTADEIIPYNGGTPVFSSIFSGPLGAIAFPNILAPSARETVARWARRDQCRGGLTRVGAAIDLEQRIPGAETTMERYDCPAPYGVELWSIDGGPPRGGFGPLDGANSAHIPAFYYHGMPGFHEPPGHDPAFPDRIYDWLIAHPKP